MVLKKEENPMKAVMYLEKGKVGVCDIEKPVCPPDELMVKIEYCALCATDEMCIRDRRRPRTAPGGAAQPP